MKYYSTIKRNKALIHTTTLINLENIMLSELSQTQIVTYYGKSTDRSRFMVAMGWGKGEMESDG